MMVIMIKWECRLAEIISRRFWFFVKRYGRADRHAARKVSCVRNVSEIKITIYDHTDSESNHFAKPD